ncbi:MAG: hypothetical protein ACI9GW_002865, partial [Halieaceae bacterium]
GLHKSRTSYFRLKREAQREMAPLDERGSVIPTLVHSSVRQRFDSDPQYRPANLMKFLENRHWDDIVTD